MKTTEWKNVSEKEKFGVGIFTYAKNKTHHLELFCGDTVHNLLEIEGWYYGYSTKNRSIKGIYPKAFVYIKECVTEQSGVHDLVFAKEPSIAHEITTILREWGTIAKQRYVYDVKEFEEIWGRMIKLIEWRKRILSGTLPVDELKELKRKITSLIDVGNEKLSLDLVVRDQHGNILDSESTSTVHMYRQHVEATDRIRKARDGVASQKPVTQFCHNLYVTIRNFICKVGDDLEVLMSLYDSRECKFISENYVVKWPKGILDIDHLNALRVIFTDLGSKDLAREKVFLVCQIARFGLMEVKDPDSKKHAAAPKKFVEPIRRPVGVAVMDVTEFINGNTESDEEKQHFLPFVQCGERDFLDTMTRKLTSVKEVTHKDHKGQGVWVSLKMLHGDIKQVREENPHLISITTSIARKMGFPEMILPGDVRNDLYLTIVMGEFSKGAKTSDKNVEVSVKAVNVNGQVIPNAISLGSGIELSNEYCTVVYYHEDKPKWYETVKVTIPIEEFYNAHLVFTFKHRSSSEAKDRNEKPFAMAFVKLMKDNGTTLKDENHDLLVYKIDHKKFEPTDTSYLSLPSTRQQLDTTSKQVPHGGGLTLNNRDSFQMSTLVCSTKLTQNVDLLGLLKWRENPSNLKHSLTILMKVDGEEVVKFLQDTLDALFNILMEREESEYDSLVFDAIVFILGIVSHHKYQHFRPVLDAYVNENFSATLAYDKLIISLKNYIDRATEIALQETLLKTTKSLEYIFKFIVKSRVLFARLNEGKGTKQFEITFKNLLESINIMMYHTNDSALTIQATCLKFLPSAISVILEVYNAYDLSLLLVSFVNNIPGDRLIKQKLMCINDLVHGELFQIAESRAILLSVFVKDHVKILLEKREEKELCITILSDILEVLHNQPPELVREDIGTIIRDIFRTVVQTVIHMDRNHPLVGNLVSVMISILRQMEATHYHQYIEHFPHSSDLLDFLIEILMVFSDLVSKTVFSKDWNEMILMQNSVILKALRHFSHTIRDKFSCPFEIQVWNNFFHCAISFLTQDALQLENFSESKRKKIISKYKDMRRETGFEIRSMWFNLGQNKIYFVPSLIGPFLEMTLIPERELRKATITIFFDMMQCEFYSPRFLPSPGVHLDGLLHSRETIRGGSAEFENELITQLDALVAGGRGDDEYKNLFCEIMTQLCESHSILKDKGVKFVKMVSKLLECLLEYRSIIQEENKENRITCTVNLMEFYDSINRKEMYIRYLNKLCDLHVECQNFTEAAFALKLHTQLLEWSDDPLPPILKNEKYPNRETHRDLKESLYHEIIDYFDKGKMWEPCLDMCKELAQQYENETFDYAQLSELLRRMAGFYSSILRQMRLEPEYFRVAFVGKGYPTFVQNKVFIYRGKEYEKLDEFTGRLQNQFPKAQVMNKLTPPTQADIDGIHQLLQVNKVDSVMEEKRKFSGRKVDRQILKFYEVNDVQKFTFSRPVRKGVRDSDNEFSNLWIERTTMIISHPLPGILRWFPVISSEMCEISPLENAIEAMETINKRVRDSIMAHRAEPNLPENSLGMLLNGIVDAAVNGGIAKYEQAFFNDEYLLKHDSPKDKEDVSRLKQVIASQIPLLEVAMAIHKSKVPDSLRPFHERMEQCFKKMKTNVEEKYGKGSCDLEPHPVAGMRRAKTMFSETNMVAISLPNINNINSEADRLRLGLGVTLRTQQSSPLKLSPASRVQSVFAKPMQSSTKVLWKSKENMTLRRSSESQSQWYDGRIDPTTPVIELSETLISQRPLRSEAERRLSRPSSGNYRSVISENSSPPSTPSGGASTHSLNALEDETPPPLPQKQNTTDNGEGGYVGITSMGTLPRKSSGTTTRVKNKPLPPLPIKEKTPPAIPKKPSSRLTMT